MVEGAFWTEFFFGGGHDLVEIIGAGFRMRSEPEKIKDADFAVLFHRAGLLVEREAASEMIGRGPRSLSGKNAGQDVEGQAGSDRFGDLRNEHAWLD